MSDTPVESVTVRRRSLRGEPTSTLSPSPEASLASMVGRGKGINEIALHLALTHDEVRERLSAAGLLELVEAPDAPVAALPTLGPAFVLTRTPDAPPVVSQEPKRRGRPPKVREPVAAAPPPVAAPVAAAAPVAQPTVEDFTDLGLMTAEARKRGVTLDVFILDARRTVYIADLFGF